MVSSPQARHTRVAQLVGLVATDGTYGLRLSIIFTVGCDDLGAPHRTICTRTTIGANSGRPQQALSLRHIPCKPSHMGNISYTPIYRQRGRPMTAPTRYPSNMNLHAVRRGRRTLRLHLCKWFEYPKQLNHCVSLQSPLFTLLLIFHSQFSILN